MISRFQASPWQRISLVLVVAFAAILLAAGEPANAQSTVMYYALPRAGSTPWAIALGPDGALWFTEYAGNKIGRITTGGAIREFVLPNSDSFPTGIAAGPDGALWFTEEQGNRVGRITTGGVMTEFPLPTANSTPQAIAAGPDAALWFTETGASRIGRITTGGVITEFPLRTASGRPHGIAAAPDGALWFTEQNGNSIGRITTGGVITEFPLPASSDPTGIAAGSDGALWFTEPQGNRIGRITTGGVVTHFSLPTAFSYPFGISAGPDGALWFTQLQGTVGIGRITTGGAITEFSTGTSTCVGSTLGITVGPDAALWFTEACNRIGRLGPPPLPTTSSSLSLNGSTSFAEAPHALELNVTSDWTIEAWFKDEHPAGYSHQRTRILTKGDTAEAEVPYLLGVETDGLFAGLRSGGIPYVARYDLRQNNVSPNAWHHVAATLDRSSRELRLYLDGVKVARTVLPTLSVGNDLPLRIGRSGPVSGDAWKGKIDDVRIWNVVRTEDQIGASFQRQLSSPQPSLVGNWRFDEGIGSTAADSGGTQQNASLQGGAGFSTDTPN